MIIKKKIVLLGYMGSVKSSIAKLISKKLDLMNVDLDNYIERKENKSISDIFDQVYTGEIKKRGIPDERNIRKSFTSKRNQPIMHKPR